jgi:uridine kinase
MLMPIFDRRITAFKKILSEIERRKSNDRPFVVGINGIDCSGKSLFAGALAQFLHSKGYQTQLISLDDFHNPREIRYAGEDQVDNYYNRSFNINLIIEELLAPVHQKKAVSTRLTLLDLNSDKYELVKDYAINRDTIIIIEGVFLFRKELAPYIDYKMFLEISFEESKQRAKDRDPETIIKKYDDKYLPAQRIYLEEYPPSNTADIIIDNTAWESPRITYLK